MTTSPRPLASYPKHVCHKRARLIAARNSKDLCPRKGALTDVTQLAYVWMGAGDPEVGMRKLISGMKISVDGKMEGPEGNRGLGRSVVGGLVEGARTTASLIDAGLVDELSDLPLVSYLGP